MKKGIDGASYRAASEFLSDGRRTIVLGTGPLARQIVRAILDRGRGEYQFLGAVDDTGSTRVREGAHGFRILGPVARLEKILAAYKPECIVVAVTGGKMEIMERLLLFLLHSETCIKHGIEVYEELTGQVPIDTLTPDDLVFGREVRPSALSVYVNRLISLLLAAIGIVVTAPLMVFLMLAVRLDSEGPAIYVQDRAGLHGRRFGLLKFRTMRLDASDRSVWAAENADRITRVGEWLRKFRLDELPQLFNVIRGDMNLVGPRPHPSPSSELVELISRNIAECGVAMPYYSMRSIVRPGITGWAQVRYKYANGLSEELEKLRYDLYYVKHYSVWLDLRILAMTLSVIAGGSGNGRLNDQPVPSGSPVRRLTGLPVCYTGHQEEDRIRSGATAEIRKPLILANEKERRTGAER